MKASELMIGDMIRQSNSGLLLQVSCIQPPYITAVDEEGQFHEDTIEPIPLTAEILRKNGVPKHSLMGEQCHFIYWVWGIDLLAIYDADFSFRIGDAARKVKYVHQLQHILRLCGIDKEITL